MKKVTMFIICFFFLTIYGSREINAAADNDSGYSQMTMTISFSDDSFIFKNDVDVYLDSAKICTMKSGGSNNLNMMLRNAVHNLSFYKSGTETFFGNKLIKVENDSHVSCVASIKNKEFKFEEFTFSDGVDVDIAEEANLIDIDAYYFSFSNGHSSVRTKRGSSWSVSYYDMVNGIVVNYHYSKGKGKVSEWASPSRILVKDGKYIYHYRDDGTISDSWLTYEDGILTSYNNEGEVVKEEEVGAMSVFIPETLKKAGFLEEYPNPSVILKDEQE